MGAHFRGAFMVPNRKTFILLLLLIAALLSGCEGEDPIQLSNPNANDDILWQTVFGDANKESTIWHMVVDSELNVYFCGLINDKQCVGRIGTDGELDWSYDLQRAYGIRLTRFPTSSSDEAIIVCGGIDSDGDNRSNRGYIVILDKDGAPLLQEIIENDTCDVWLNDLEVTAVNPSGIVLVAGGGVRRNGIRYPYMNKIEISNNGEMKSLNDTVFVDLSNQYIWYMTWNNEPVQPAYFASVAQYSGDESIRCSVISVNDSLRVLWNVSPYPPGISRSYYDRIGYSAGTVFVVGESLVQRDNAYWWAGAVAALKESGDINWTKTIQLSEYDDVYLDLIIAEDTLFAVGYYSSVIEESTNHAYGYGLISKYDISNGEAVFHKTFGEHTCRSQFFASYLKDNRVFCGGLSRYFVENYWHQGWIMEADCSDESTSLKTCPPVNALTPGSESAPFSRKE